VIGHGEQPGQDVAAHFGRAGLPGDPETIAPARYFDIETALDLPQVFIELTAQVGKAVIIGGLENDVPRYLDSTQNLYSNPLRSKQPVRTTGTLPVAAANLSGQ
jgi:hypothetical protein